MWLLALGLCACTGEPSWPRTWGTPEQDVAAALTVGSSGAIAVAWHTTGARDVVLDRFGGDETDTGDTLRATIQARPYALAATDDAIFSCGTFEGELTAPKPGGDTDRAVSVDVGGWEEPGGDIFVARRPRNRESAWLIGFGAMDLDVGTAIAAAPSGDAVLAASFELTVDFGAGPLTSADSAIMPGFVSDVAVVALRGDGTTRWATRAGGLGQDVPTGVALDDAGDVVVVGSFALSADFGDQQLTVAGKGDAFVAKLAGLDGAVLWARPFGGVELDGATGVALDADSNVFVVGYFQDSMVVEGDVLRSAGDSDVFVMKLSAMGDVLWSRQFGGTGRDLGSGLAVRDGRVAVVGRFSDEVSFGDVALHSAGEQDIFVLALSSADGSVQGARRYGGPGSDYALDVAFGPDGEIVLSGAFSDSVDFDGAVRTSRGKGDGFVHVTSMP